MNAGLTFYGRSRIQRRLFLDFPVASGPESSRSIPADHGLFLAGTPQLRPQRPNALNLDWTMAVTASPSPTPCPISESLEIGRDHLLVPRLAKQPVKANSEPAIKMDYVRRGIQFEGSN